LEKEKIKSVYTVLVLIYPEVHCLQKQKDIRADWIYKAYAVTSSLCLC